MLNITILRLLDKLLSFGTLWQNGKSITGLAAILLSILGMLMPEGFMLGVLTPAKLEMINQILLFLGFTLTPIGLGHKVVKRELGK